MRAAAPVEEERTADPEDALAVLPVLATLWSALAEAVLRDAEVRVPPALRVAAERVAVVLELLAIVPLRLVLLMRVPSPEAVWAVIVWTRLRVVKALLPYHPS